MQTKATTPLSAAAQPQTRETESAEWLLDVGASVSLDSLPPPETKRWVIRRKAEVVAAVRAGLLSLEEAAHATRSRWKNSSPGSASSTATAFPACASRVFRTTARSIAPSADRRGRLSRDAGPTSQTRHDLPPGGQNLPVS